MVCVAACPIILAFRKAVMAGCGGWSPVSPLSGDR